MSRWIAAVLCGWALAAAAEPLPVRVGAYHFPPYVVHPERAEVGGLLPELLRALNQQQARFRFELVPTSSERRYQDFTSGRFDMMLFESPEWGWQGVDYRSLSLGIRDSVVFVARALPGRGEDYFADLSPKRLGLYRGYHYAFADYEVDEDRLRQRYDVVFVRSFESGLQMLLHDRVDVVPLNRSYLERHLTRHPDLRPQLLVGTRIDQLDRHLALLRPEAPLTAEDLLGCLRQLRESGRLDALLQHYALAASEPAGLGVPAGP
jgi:ABC-type amino acid transport substrate-binding protein